MLLDLKKDMRELAEPLTTFQVRGLRPKDVKK